MRHRCHVANQGEIEADGLQGAHGGLTSRSRPSHQDLNFFEAVPHRLARCILRDHLGRIRGAFAGTFEADFSGARPPDDVAVQIGDRDNGVVKCGKNMGDARMDVLAAFGLNDLWLFYVVRVQRKIFARRLGLRLFFLLSLLRRLGGGFRLRCCSFDRRGFGDSLGRFRRSLRRFSAARLRGRVPQAPLVFSPLAFRLWTWLVSLIRPLKLVVKLCRLSRPCCESRPRSCAGPCACARLSMFAGRAPASRGDAARRDNN